MLTAIASTETITREVASAIGYVGQVVTYRDRQFTVHSVEGPDWYAFDDQGLTTVDFNMTMLHRITEPMALIIPAGSVVGEGFGQEVPLRVVRRGVCLAKAWSR